MDGNIPDDDLGNKQQRDAGSTGFPALTDVDVRPIDVRYGRLWSCPFQNGPVRFQGRHFRCIKTVHCTQRCLAMSEDFFLNSAVNLTLFHAITVNQTVN